MNAIARHWGLEFGTIWFLLAATAGAAAPEASPPSVAPLGVAATVASSARIVNVFDDFVAYHDRCKDLDAAARRQQWQGMLEDRHKDFFDEVIYRKLAGADRDRQKDYCFETFWKEVVPKLSQLAKVNASIQSEMDAVLADFRKVFGDFKPSDAFYVTVSFSFKGKVVEVKGKKVLAIGLENFDAGGAPLRITIAHEMFHLYHAPYFDTSGGLYRPLWAEGLATYVASVVVPGYRNSVYLGFDGAKMNRCQELLPKMAAELAANLGQNDPRLQRIYFGAEANNTPIPPEAGYYVGLLVAEAAAKQTPLADLAKMDSQKVFRLLQDHLRRLQQ